MKADEFVNKALMALIDDPPCVSTPQSLLNEFLTVVQNLNQSQLNLLLSASLRHVQRYQTAIMEGSVEYDCMDSQYDIHALTNTLLPYVNFETSNVLPKREKGGDLELL